MLREAIFFISWYYCFSELSKSDNKEENMEHVYAFTDEYGAFGWDLDNPTVSTHFIITSIIVSEANLELCREKIELVRKKFFKDSEIK